MSIWFSTKRVDGGKSILAIDIPWELVLAILGFVLTRALILLQKVSDPYALLGYSLMMPGFGLFLISKISLFAKGIWVSWGPKEMTTPFKICYILGYLLIISGVVMSLVGIVTNV